MAIHKSIHACVIIAAIGVAAIFGICPPASGQTILYVKADAAGANNGTSWANAFTDLQSALATAPAGSEIWVAAGTYKPTGPGGSRMATFQMRSDVGMYGGFAGTESSRSQRSIAANETTLSGDLNGNDDPAVDLLSTAIPSMDDNAYNVVRAAGVNASAVLDGFTIRGGNATDPANINDPFAPTKNGGGCSISNASPVLRNCKFTRNRAYRSYMGFGGSVFILGGDLVLIANCLFEANSARNAGAISSYSTDDCSLTVRIVDCRFYRNTALNEAGACNLSPGFLGGRIEITNSMFVANSCVDGASAIMISGNNYEQSVFSLCTVVDNGASPTNAYSSGAIYGSGAPQTLLISNSILWGNWDVNGAGEAAQVHNAGAIALESCCVQGWTGQLGGTGNFGGNPQFVRVPSDGGDGWGLGNNDDYGDLHLRCTSPCMDTGNSTLLPSDGADLDGDGDQGEPIPLDLDGTPRVIGSGLNRGAIEGAGSQAMNVVGSPLNVPEGSVATASVSLACRPAEPVTVRITRLSGSSNLTIPFGDTLTFTPTDYSIPQRVVFASAQDLDLIGESSIFRVQSDNLPDELIAVSQIDDDVPSVIYVRAGATGANNGTSWTDAFTDLRVALAFAANSNGAVREVWVSAGTYTPAGPGGDRSALFRVPNHVAVLGGFAGTETSRVQRDIEANPTVLSGDLNHDDIISASGCAMPGTCNDAACLAAVNGVTGGCGGDFAWSPGCADIARRVCQHRTDNSYRIVESIDVDNSSILDGFKVSGAYDERPGNWGSVEAFGEGGGLLCVRSSGVFRNCVFADNRSTFGGGVAHVSGIPTFEQCRLIGNWAYLGAGAFSDSTDEPRFLNCLFDGNVNRGFDHGPAVYANSVMMIGCTVVSNPPFAYLDFGAYGYHSAVYAYNGGLYNCILWGNGGSDITLQQNIYGGMWNCCVQGWPSDPWNLPPITVDVIGADPLFVNPAGVDGIVGTLDDDYHLQPGSSCIDRGDSSVDVDPSTPGVQRISSVDLDNHYRQLDDPNAPNLGAGPGPSIDIGAFEFGSPPMPARLYVNKQVAGGASNGATWVDAYAELRDALDIASRSVGHVAEIWAAAGTYPPDASVAQGGGNRSATFQLVDNLGIYGHFAGTETSLAQRDLNNPINETTLTGDIEANDGPGFTNITDNCLHVVSSGGVNQSAVLDGFTIRSGNANIANGVDEFGGGACLGSGVPTIHHCRFVDNSALSGGAFSAADGQSTAGAVTLDLNQALEAGSSGFLRNRSLILDDMLTLNAGVLELQASRMSGLGQLRLNPGSLLKISGQSFSEPQSVLQCRVTGTGHILIDFGQRLHLDGGAAVDLSDSQPGTCADPAQSTNWGTITCNGELVVRNADLRNTNVNVKLGDVGGATAIINNDIRMVQASAGFGGQFFVTADSTIACNVVVSEGDRYLDFDPDPSAAQHATILNNKFYVIMKQGVNLDQGELLELRTPDQDFATIGGGQSGAWQLASSAGYSDTWVLEQLEVMPGAKCNLTNRQGFVFQNPTISIPEALYVKTVKLHPGAVLNTGLQRMYYQTLVDENDAALAVNPNDPHALLANGSRLVDVPLLGFSLKVIAMEDDTEFGVRLRTRLRDAGDVQPPVAPFKEGEVVRVAAPTSSSPTNHAMAMRTSKTSCPPGSPPCPSASSIAAHGAFARAGENQIEIKFNYKFCGQPGDELIVYLSDSPDVVSGNGPSPNLIEVARLYPPTTGPGSIGSSDFASFSGRFPRGALNFTRGTYVELELRGPDACVLIDDFDPVVCLWCACGDFSGEGACGVEALDYLYLLSEYGSSVNDTNLCADQVGLDHYVDLSDLMNWSNDFHNPAALDLCSGSAGAAGGSASASTVLNGLILAGKPTGNNQNDALYPVNTQTFLAGSAINAPVQNNGTRSGNGPLVRNVAGALYQLHGVLGLIRLSDGQVTLAPKTFNNVNMPNVTSGSTVRVGLSSGGGYALLDAAFDPTDPSGNTLFVLPVQVDPPGNAGSGCPYRAAAKVQLTGGGNCTLLAVYGLNPASGSTVVATGSDCAEMVYAPDASRMRELDVDAYGNLFVTSAQGVNDNNYVLIYPAGSSSEIRASLAGQVQAPTALHVDGNYLYVSTSLDGADTTGTEIHRYHILRGGNLATGLDTSPTGHAVITIPGIRFLTAITTNPGDGRLYAAGFGSTSCTRAQCTADPNCPLGCRFNPGDQIFTTPMLAGIANPTGTNPPNSTPVVTVSAITSANPDPTQNLGLPISLAFNGTACGTGDLNGDGQTNPADIAPFVTALLSSTPPQPNTLCAADTNGDNTLNGRDISAFVRRIVGG